MATPSRDVDMTSVHYSSSPDLSSLPSESPSEPGSPSRHDQRRMSLGRRSDEIIVDPSAGARFASLHQQSTQHPDQQPGQPQPFSLDASLRLTKEGVPRKKPGRKPGVVAKKAGDGAVVPAMSAVTAAGSGVEAAAKAKRPRKPKDPNAPPVPRKKRAQPTPPLAADDTADARLARSSSANIRFEPKMELTSMRMDIDSRPTPNPALHALGPSAILASSASHPPPRQPPLAMMDKMPKRETHHSSSVMSILNSDDSPPRPAPAAPTSTTPIRSGGQNFDPVRSSTYDPVRGTMVSRDPYGTSALGSPRAPTQLTNRASASPSINSLIDPAPISHTRSPAGSFSIAHQASPPPMSIAAATTSAANTAALPRYHRENVPSMPPSPSPIPAIRAVVAPSSRQPSATPTANTLTAAAAKAFTATATTAVTAKASSARPSPQAAAMSKTSTSAVPPLSLTSRPSAVTKASATAKTAAKAEANGQGKAHSKPPPPPPVPASAKASTPKATTTKASEKKAAAAAKAAATKAATAAAAAAAAASASEASSSASTDVPAPSKGSGPAAASFKDVTMSGTEPAAAPAPHIKKFSSILHSERGGKPGKASASAASSPKLSSAKGDGLPSALASLDSSPQPAGSEPERSILDFGKALPGEEHSAPSIVLHIPLIKGETNKYINFMRLAEDRYGWDALHPRLAAHRDRKLRIAAASAALERNGSGRESGDEMTDDMQSGDEGSNEENAAGADNGTNGVNASGPDDVPAKPVRKKRIFKEDEYDKDDDFVDDSEMLWEEQAAASRDGFFVYSGPLVPEEEKPAEGTTTPAKRGRGTRGGRGGASRSAGSRATTGRGAGGAGSRGGTTTRKPRATKQEREQREREKAELEKASAKASAKDGASASTSLSTSMAIDV